MAERLIKRILKNLIPKIYSEYLAPKEAVIVNVGRLSKEAVLDDAFLPSYAVDVRLLNTNGDIDESLPVLQSLPLPLNHGGGESGFYGVPKEGMNVVVHFIGGMASKPYIQTILSTGSTVPGLKRGDMVWSKGEGVHQKLDHSGNWERKTNQDIFDSCDTLNQQARSVNEIIGQKNSEIKGHWLSKCVGYFKVMAMGCISIVSGARLNISAAETLNMISLNDMNVSTAKKLNVNSKEDMTLASEKKTTINSTGDMALKSGGKVHVGSDTVNLVKQVSDLADQVNKLATFSAAQLYGGTGSAVSPDAADATGVGTKATSIKDYVDGLL